MTITEAIQSNKHQIGRAFGVPAHMLADPDRTAMPRYWSLCMTSENHGTVGKAGDPFSHAPGKHERVLVVEVPAGAGAPTDQVNLRLITAPVEAQAGQVAVPEGWKLVPTHPDQFMINAFITEYERPGGSESGCYRAMLAAAPVAPAASAQAVATPALVQPPSPTECWSVNEEGFSHDSLAELLDNHPELEAGSRVFVGEAAHPALNRLIDSDDVIVQMGDRADDIAGEYADGYPDVSAEDKAELDALLAAWIEKACPPTFYEVKNVRAYVITEQDISGAQASISGERQEGGA